VEAVTFHRDCFRCTTCRRRLHTSFEKSGQGFFCPAHFKQITMVNSGYMLGSGPSRSAKTILQRMSLVGAAPCNPKCILPATAQEVLERNLRLLLAEGLDSIQESSSTGSQRQCAGMAEMCGFTNDHLIGKAEMCGFTMEHLIGKAQNSASVTANLSDDEDSNVMAKLSTRTTSTLTTNSCDFTDAQAFDDDRCSDSEEENECDMMMVTHARADGHLKSQHNVPHHGWRWAQARAIFSDSDESHGPLNSACSGEHLVPSVEAHAAQAS